MGRPEFLATGMLCRGSCGKVNAGRLLDVNTTPAVNCFRLDLKKSLPAPVMHVS
jgi:hypothetical protein